MKIKLTEKEIMELSKDIETFENKPMEESIEKLEKQINVEEYGE